MEERWNSLPDYLRREFGRRLYKVPLNAGMTCPNRDGTAGTGGCLFCSEGGSGEFALPYHGQPLKKEDLIYSHRDGKEGDYIAYFQSFTNTYAPAGRLRFLYESALRDPLFAGISAATRPDCFPEEVYDLLAQLKGKYPEKFIWIELGLQTVHNSTAAMIRRGYDTAVFDECVRRLRALDIPVIVHIIIGLPGEDKKMVYQTIDRLNHSGVKGVKLQLLHYLRDSDLGRLYEKNPASFHPLTMEEYTEIITECIARLDPGIVIHRLTGDGSGDTLLAPLWSAEKLKVLNQIRHELKRKNIRQGCRKENTDEQSSRDCQKDVRRG